MPSLTCLCFLGLGITLLCGRVEVSQIFRVRKQRSAHKPVQQHRAVCIGTTSHPELQSTHIETCRPRRARSGFCGQASRRVSPSLLSLFRFWEFPLLLLLLLFLRVPCVSSCRLSPLVLIGIGVPVEVRVALLWIIANGEHRWWSHRLFASPVLVLRRRSVLPLETDASRRRPNAHARCSATRGSAIPNRNPHCYESLQLVVRHAMPRRTVPHGLDASLGLSTRVR